MKSDKIFRGISQIDADLIEEPKSRAWVKWVAAAAACLLAAVAAVALFPKGSPALPEEPKGSLALPGEPMSSAGGAGHREGMAFMSYEGPVFPLTARNGADGIEAVRTTDFDFSAFTSESSFDQSVCTVTDSYTLFNTTGSDKTVELFYPYAGNFQKDTRPQVFLNGGELETELVSGFYSGSFRGAGGDTESMNLNNISSWEGYKALLSDGKYLEEAFSDVPKLTQKVTVYEIYNISGGEVTESAESLNVTLTGDLAGSSVFTYRFNGASNARGVIERSFFLPRPQSFDFGKSRYIVILGEDAAGCTLQGYKNGACKKGQETDATAEIARFEMTLGEILEKIAREHYDDCLGREFDGDHNRYISREISFEAYFGEICRFFAKFSAAGSEAKERYSMGMLEDIINETIYHDRVLYRRFTVTVPAGGSVELLIRDEKQGSFDFIVDKQEDVGLFGFELVTTLGSDLAFREQRATLSGAEKIELVRQDFGFDPAAGKTDALLDAERYYMEIRYRR